MSVQPSGPYELGLARGVTVLVDLFGCAVKPMDDRR